LLCCCVVVLLCCCVVVLLCCCVVVLLYVVLYCFVLCDATHTYITCVIHVHTHSHTFMYVVPLSVLHTHIIYVHVNQVLYSAPFFAFITLDSLFRFLRLLLSSTGNVVGGNGSTPKLHLHSNASR
jgi:hypothetical protein